MSRPLSRRFWEKVAVAGLDDCWLWSGNRPCGRYGFLSVRGRNTGAHRVSFELNVAVIPASMYVLHSCDNMGCVNPKHLFLGTPADNSRDMVRKGRSASGSRHVWALYPDKRPIGVRNPKAKLTEVQVLEIRRLVKAGVSHKVVAAKFGISKSMPGRIASGDVWRHV